MVKGFFIFILFLNTSASALVGVQDLENKLFEQSPELSSLKKQVESKEALYSSGYSNFLPSVNAVGGWQQNTLDSTPTPEKGTVGYLEAQYNLFNGFKDSSNLNQKEAALSASKTELLLKQRDLKNTLVELVSEMLHLHKLQDILDEEYKTVLTQKQMAQKKEAAGLTGSVDRLEFSVRESEIEIERNQINQEHDELHQKFTKLFGSEVADSALQNISFQNFNELTDIRNEFDHNKNLDYQLAQNNLNRAVSEKVEARSEFFPKLDLTASIGRLTPSETNATRYNESKYGITLTIPLFSGLNTYNNTKAANLNISSAEKTIDQVTKNVQADFNILKNKINELSKLFKINEQKLITSQQYFDLTLGEYRRGIKNSPDLVGATERLFNTKKKQVEILKDLEILKIKIETL